MRCIATTPLNAHYISISVLQCAAVCCSVLQCVAVCCSVLQFVAVCCSATPTFAHHIVSWFVLYFCTCMLKCVVVYFNLLQCTVVTCSVLQCATLSEFYIFIQMYLSFEATLSSLSFSMYFSFAFSFSMPIRAHLPWARPMRVSMCVYTLQVISILYAHTFPSL